MENLIAYFLLAFWPLLVSTFFVEINTAFLIKKI